MAENTNRIGHLIPFEERPNTLADETVQLLLWLHDPSGRKDAPVSLSEQKRRTGNTAPEIHYKHTFSHYSYCKLSSSLIFTFYFGYSFLHCYF